MKQSYSRYFPTPVYLSMNSCALDISDQSIKYGELLATAQGLRLGRFGQEKIPPGVIVSGKIQDENALVKILKNLKAREDLEFVRVALPEEQMYLFTLSLPFMQMKDLREAILLQLEEHIPLQASDALFDYVVVSETATLLVVEVVAIATITVENYLSTFEQAGLVPLSFELEAQAIARAVIPEGDKSTVMIVDFGEARTGVSIVQDGRIFFTTTLDIGGSTLTNMIAKNFSISFEQAEIMKRSYGLEDASNVNEIFPVILNGISVLRDELNKHYVYWKTHDDGIAHRPIDRLVLCGGDANLAGLADYLQTSMGTKVEHANAWLNISDMTVSIPDMSFQESLGYTTVLGLALGDYMFESKSVLSVLPKEEKQALRRLYAMRFASMAFTLCALAGILATILLFPSYLFSASKLDFAEAKLEAFNKAHPEIASRNLDTNIEDINKKLSLLNTAKTTYAVSDSVVRAILGSRITGITLSQILFTERSLDVKTVEIHGRAVNRDTLQNFKKKLDTVPTFASVTLPISNFIERSDINFTISITLK